MSQTDTGFWTGTSFNDLFEQVVGGYVAVEQARAEAGAATQVADQAALIGQTDAVTQNPNAQPSNPSTATEVSAGSGQGASRTVVLPGGMEVNRTALYIAGAALGAALLLKVAS